MSRNTVLVVFGGSSFEHKVSLDSAQAIIDGLDKSKYHVIPLGISKAGECILGERAMQILLNESSEYTGKEDIFVTAHSNNTCKSFMQCFNALEKQPDVIFPIIHGFTGEDGRLQGMFDLVGIPYVGSGLGGSAICMDKIFTKAILEKFDIPQLPYYGFTAFDWCRQRSHILENISPLGYPLFVKPANLGSSIGISRVNSYEELIVSIDLALQYDTRVLIERGLYHPREIELAIIGNNDFLVSCPGEVIVDRKYEFYTYEAKYIDTHNTRIEVPADIPPEITEKLKNIAQESCHALNVRGLCRVDFFIDTVTGEYFLNELNTVPELTIDSMFASLWSASGMNYQDLLDNLIKYALQK